MADEPRFEGGDDDLFDELHVVEFVPDEHAPRRIEIVGEIARMRSQLQQLLAELDATGLGPLVAPNVRHTTMGDGHGGKERGVQWHPHPGWILQVTAPDGDRFGRSVFVTLPENRSYGPDVDAYDPSAIRTIARALLAAAAWADSDLVD